MGDSPPYSPLSFCENDKNIRGDLIPPYHRTEHSHFVQPMPWSVHYSYAFQHATRCWSYPPDYGDTLSLFYRIFLFSQYDRVIWSCTALTWCCRYDYRNNQRRSKTKRFDLESRSKPYIRGKFRQCKRFSNKGRYRSRRTSIA